jgi:energy-converting hydrogenase Eha subunit G
MKKNPVILALISGVLTGMGNGSVFGAALMCFLGRGKFDDWGGWDSMAYDPSTFTGFIDWAMIVFGIAFFFILHIAVKRHNELEARA